MTRSKKYYVAKRYFFIKYKESDIVSHLGDISMLLICHYRHLSVIRINQYPKVLSNAPSSWTLVLLSSWSSMSYATSTSFSSSCLLSQVLVLVTSMNILDLTRCPCHFYGRFNALGWIIFPLGPINIKKCYNHLHRHYWHWYHHCHQHPTKYCRNHHFHIYHCQYVSS